MMEHRTTNRLRAVQAIFICALAVLQQTAFGQSNYASHANNIGYRGEGLPEEATLDGKVSIIHIFIQIKNIMRIENLHFIHSKLDAIHFLHTSIWKDRWRKKQNIKRM